MQENYLAKWLNNELSDEEVTAFKKTDEFASYQRLAETSKNLETPNFDIEKALVEFRKKKSEHMNTKVISLNPLRRYLRVAAVIVLLVTGSYLYYNSLDTTLKTQYAERAEVVLPDASLVMLNADSKIAYNENKWDQKRNVDLEGEAFFKVAKGKQFTVTTEDGLVAVLGTQFNVENRAGFFEITCYEGLVSVTYKNKETQLPAGASFLVIEGEVRNPAITDKSAPSWIRDESSFTSIPLSFVLTEFQRQFDKTIETDNIDVNQLFTGTFSNTNIHLALQSISVPSQIQFKIEGNKVLFYAQNAP